MPALNEMIEKEIWNILWKMGSQLDPRTICLMFLAIEAQRNENKSENWVLSETTCNPTR